MSTRLRVGMTKEERNRVHRFGYYHRNKRIREKDIEDIILKKKPARVGRWQRNESNNDKSDHCCCRGDDRDMLSGR